VNTFFKGVRSMLPITAGVVPFGAVMGTVSADANLTLFQTVTMNLFVFAGSAQLATVDLMLKNTEAFVVILTGIVINLRFILYSAAISPVIQKSSLATKIFAAYFLTDQTYAVMSAKQSKFKTTKEVIEFYFGAAISMALVWHSSVLSGFIFGNFAPSTWALDYAVPLSFVALVAPTLKKTNYLIVAVASSILSLLLINVPYNLGLIISSGLALMLGVGVSKKRAVRDR